VDGDWRVPHFEKMLYDQAQLALAYLEAAQLTGEPFYADVAADTLEYVRRDMTDPGGGFHSAEDADSIPPEQAGERDAHKMEGAFYIWRDEEIQEALGSDADVFRRRFGILPDGNAPFDPQREFIHKNLLYTAASLEEVARDTGRSVEEVRDALERARRTLFDVRSRRPRPHLDDKVLTAWNGLMIAAFARAARVLPEGGTHPDFTRRDGGTYLDTARRAAVFIRTTMWRNGVLLRRYRGGEAAIEGYAEDYAYLIFGLLELFQADADPIWLEWASDLQRRQDELFWDEDEGGWFSTTGADPSVLLRLKEDYDGAEPAASSVAVLNLQTLAHLTGDGSAPRRVERTLALFAVRLADFGRAVPMMLAALSTYHAGMPQVVIVGPAEREDTRQLQDAARRTYRPTAIVLDVDPRRQGELARVLSWIGPMSMRDGRATAYVCRDFACQAPVTSPDAFLEQLRSLR
jgi:uncharacterized protein YyaL (SSP411 family)